MLIVMAAGFEPSERVEVAETEVRNHETLTRIHRLAPEKAGRSRREVKPGLLHEA